MNDNTINGIVCDATNCVYNDDKACHANQVKVGCASACCADDTACDTFMSK